MISASWSLQRADHGEQPYWAVMLLASCLGQIGLPGGGFGFGYGSASGIAEPPLAFRAPGMESAAQSAQPRHSGGAHRPMPAASRRDLRLQRPQQHLSGHQAGVLGGRQSVPPSPGHQPAARRLPPAANHRRARAVVDGDRAPRRHRAAGDDHARAQRYRLRAARPLCDRHAESDRAGRRGAQRLCAFSPRSRAARLRRRLHPRPRRDGMAAAPLR